MCICIYIYGNKPFPPEIVRLGFSPRTFHTLSSTFTFNFHVLLYSSKNQEKIEPNGIIYVSFRYSFFLHAAAAGYSSHFLCTYFSFILIGFAFKSRKQNVVSQKWKTLSGFLLYLRMNYYAQKHTLFNGTNIRPKII